MKKNICILLLGIILFSCKEKEKIKSPYSGIRIINNAEYYYGGVKEITLVKNNDVNYVINKIKSLTDDKANEVQININFGYAEIKLLDEEKKEGKYFSIVFTEFYGDIIRYDGKHYYYNNELVDFIKKKLKMWKVPRRSNELK